MAITLEQTNYVMRKFVDYAMSKLCEEGRDEALSEMSSRMATSEYANGEYVGAQYLVNPYEVMNPILEKHGVEPFPVGICDGSEEYWYRDAEGNLSNGAKMFQSFLDELQTNYDKIYGLMLDTHEIQKGWSPSFFRQSGYERYRQLVTDPHFLSEDHVKDVFDEYTELRYMDVMEHGGAALWSGDSYRGPNDSFRKEYNYPDFLEEYAASIDKCKTAEAVIVYSEKQSGLEFDERQSVSEFDGDEITELKNRVSELENQVSKLVSYIELLGISLEEKSAKKEFPSLADFRDRVSKLQQRDEIKSDILVNDKSQEDDKSLG